MNNAYDRLTANRAIELHFAKHGAINEGNLNTLLDIKKRYPEIFLKREDELIHNMIEYAQLIQSSKSYRQFCDIDSRTRISLITVDGLSTKSTGK